MYSVDFEYVEAKARRIEHELWLECLPVMQKMLDKKRLEQTLGPLKTCKRAALAA